MGVGRLILAQPVLGIVILLAAFLSFNSAVTAQEGETSTERQPHLRSGAIELGFGGALTVIEGTTSGMIFIRAAGFQSFLSSLWAGELAVGLSHRNSLNSLDIQGAINWQKELGGGSTYPFVAIAGGLRQEWLGSFRQARFPIGINLGLRNLISSRVGIRTEYWFRRILGDPVANFSEHRLVLGLSLFVNNSQ